MHRVLVTGANSGIGLALCAQLLADHGCHVFLGARSIEKGAAAVASIVEKHPGASGKIEAVKIDVADPVSVKEAAASIMGTLGGGTLHGVVNNAGCGLSHGVDADTMFGTNLYGTKNVVDAFLPLLDPADGRIVNVASDVVWMYLKGQSDETKALFTKQDLTWEELDAYVSAERASGKSFEGGPGYMLSKASVAAYSLALANKHPNLQINSVNPGYVDTALTAGMGNIGLGDKTQPSEATVAYRKCLFEDKAKLVNGAFYGADGLRSPFTVQRMPGSEEYTGPEGTCAA
jgi:NAD(P)-dependent dehydrogenase (short-subunit alcohol dehydrogenase family)